MRRPTTTSRRRSAPRDTAQEQRSDVLIHYPYHPRAGERITIVRTVHHAGSLHFTVDLPDGTRGLLPAWMTEPEAAGLSLVDMPQVAAWRATRASDPVDSPLLSSGAFQCEREDRSDVGCAIPAAIGPSYHRATMDTERQRLAPGIRATVSRLLKQLLSECVAGAAARPVDE